MTFALYPYMFKILGAGVTALILSSVVVALYWIGVGLAKYDEPVVEKRA